MKSSHNAALAGLCLFSGSGWLLEQYSPREIGFPYAGLIHFLVIALVATVAWLIAGRAGIPIGKATKLALAGAGVFALPTIALATSAEEVSGFTSLALFCSVPLVTILILSGSNTVGRREPGPRVLLTSVLGLGGALLVFPAHLPGSAKGRIFFGMTGGCCVLLAFAGIQMHRLTKDVAVATATALTSLGCAAAFWVSALFVRWTPLSSRSVVSEVLRCLVFDLPVALITIWLIREIDPDQLSARFLLVPLVTALEGYAVVGAGLGPEAGVGLSLMAGCGAALVLDKARDDDDDISTLHLR